MPVSLRRRSSSVLSEPTFFFQDRRLRPLSLCRRLSLGDRILSVFGRMPQHTCRSDFPGKGQGQAIYPFVARTRQGCPPVTRPRCRYPTRYGRAFVGV